MTFSIKYDIKYFRIKYKPESHARLTFVKKMKKICFILSLFIAQIGFAQSQAIELVEVSPLSSYEEVCEEGVINTLNHEYFSFTPGVMGKKEVFLVHVDQKVLKGGEEAFLNSKGFTLLRDPVNYFFGAVVAIDAGESNIACPIEGKQAMLYYKERCDCSGSEKAKITRSSDPSRWGGAPDGALFFLAEKLDS